jgi:hypothetical protein
MFTESKDEYSFGRVLLPIPHASPIYKDKASCKANPDIHMEGNPGPPRKDLNLSAKGEVSGVGGQYMRGSKELITGEDSGLSSQGSVVLTCAELAKTTFGVLGFTSCYL